MRLRGVLFLILSASSVVGAQERSDCTFSSVGPAGGSTLPSGEQFTWASSGVTIRCPSRGIVLKGDSVQRYPDRSIVVGHVSYIEPRLDLTSDYLTYYSIDDRVV